MERLTSGSEWRHAPEACAQTIMGDFEKVSWVELSPASREDGWLSRARGGLGQVSHEMGRGRWKSQNRKNVYLSPYVEEPLNWKVIKSFVPELRSRKCFSCFEIPMFYVIYFTNIPCTFQYSSMGMLQYDFQHKFNWLLMRWYCEEVWSVYLFKMIVNYI